MQKVRAVVKLIIVDDEKTTRESLTEYIPWSNLNIDSVRTAKNGVEALSMADQDPPDILLTDVRMPKMDGLELAARVRIRFPSCKIVFLSGYADTEYLKKAIHLQAISYIEKPIDPEEVKEVMRTAVSRHEEELKEKQEADRVRKSYLENMSIIRQQITSELVKGNEKIGKLRETFPDAIPNFPSTQYFTAAVLVINWKRMLSDSEKEYTRKRILLSCSDIPPSNLPSSFLGFTENDTMAIVLAGRYMELSPRSRKLYDGLLQTLQDLSVGRYTVSIGVGVPVVGLENLPRSYASALQSADLQFYRGSDRVLFPASKRGDKFSIGADVFARFRGALLDGDGEQAALLVNEVAEEARALEFIHIDTVRNVFFNLILIFFEIAWSKRIIDPFSDEEKTYIWQEIRERASLSELTDFIQQNIQAIFSSSDQCTRISRKILEIQRYIRNNYTSMNLSLQTIADKSGLSRTYLSSFFKKAMGKNINDYITQMRIDKAKELLKDCRMRTYEVARSVGYQDAHYFSTLFKRHVGCTPNEYRDRY